MVKSKRSRKQPIVTAPPMSAPQPTKKVRVHLPIHDSQEALALRGMQVDEDLLSIVFLAPPGYGKTRAVARYISLRKEKDISLTFFVASTAYMAFKQSVEIGSNFSYCYQHAKQSTTISRMLMEGSVLTTMTPAMFHKVVLGENRNQEQMDPLLYFKTTILPMVSASKCTTIRFMLDEIHTYLSDGIPEAVDELRKAAAPIKVVVSGLTATLNADDAAKLAHLTGHDTPFFIEYTDKEMATFRSDLCCQPKVGSFTSVSLPDPSQMDKFAPEMEDMAMLIVGAMLIDETTIKTRTCLEHATSKIVAKLAHEGGGEIMRHAKPAPMQQIDKKGKLAGTTKDHQHALVVAHATLCGASTALVELDAAHGQEGVCDYSYHDLRSSNISTLDDQIDNFKASFLAQEKLALAIINPSMRHSTNAFDKNTSGAVAVGCKWNKKGLKQLAGRLGRPSKMKEGDIVPKEFLLLHLDSDWQKAVLSIRSVRVSMRSVVLSEDEASLLQQIMESDRPDKEKYLIEANVCKLATADDKKTLGDSTMCMDYLEALTDETKFTDVNSLYEAKRAELLTYKDAEDAALCQE